MVRDLGWVRPGTTLYIPFHTFDSNDPSASVTITGLATTDIEIYRDGNMTQRASDSGYALIDTDGIDLDGTTGIHGISIDLSDNTTAGFYRAGAQYWVVLASITVDAATVNHVLATFRIGYEAAVVNTYIDTLSSQTSFTLPSGEGSGDNDAYNGWTAVVHDVASRVQVARGVVSDYVGSTRTITLKDDPGIFTMAAADQISLFPPSGDVDGSGRANVGEWIDNAVTHGTGGPDVNVNAVSDDTTAAANLEADYDGTGFNKSNSTIGTTTTNTDMRGTDNAALASVLGALADAAAAGDPTSADTVMQYLKQIVNTLEGTAGIPTFPAEAAPANNVSLAEIIRAIHADVTGLNGDAMRGTDSALLASSAPSNFGDLSITASTGRVDVGSWVGNTVTASGGNPDVNVETMDTGVIDSTTFAAGAVDAAATAADFIDEILDEQIGDGTLTMREALRVMIAALAGKLSGAATTTVTIRNDADTANVIVATVDSDGNRSAVTVTP